MLGKAKEYLDLTADKINLPSPNKYSPRVPIPDV